MIQAIDNPWANEAVSAQDRNMAVISHVGGYLTSFVVPLIVWLIHKDQSRYVAHHARESLNFQISQIIYFLVVSCLSVGLYFVLKSMAGGEQAWLPALGVLMLAGLGFGVFETVAVILASIAAYRGRYYRYPLCIRGV
jgi:uncharacterized Tic20 family protein